MNKYDYCPNCSIGLNSLEMQLGFCQNCKHDWSEDEPFEFEEEESLTECANCSSIWSVGTEEFELQTCSACGWSIGEPLDEEEDDDSELEYEPIS